MHFVIYLPLALPWQLACPQNRHRELRLFKNGERIQTPFRVAISRHRLDTGLDRRRQRDPIAHLNIGCYAGLCR